MIERNKYRNYEYESELEKQIGDASIVTPNAPDEDEDKLKTPEDNSWKKRYSDLRSHAQKREDSLKAELDAAKAQLDAAVKKQIKFPETEEEVEAWITKYPKVAGIVKTIAMKEAQNASLEVDKKVQALNEREAINAKREAYAALLAAHSVFEAIVQDQVFLDWVEDQPKYIYEALYVNDYDARAAIRAIDLFKADTKPQKKVQPDTRDAARTVKTPSNSQSPAGGDSDVVLESWVESLGRKGYTAEVDAKVSEAMRNGKFVYDISGAAR
jgi:hypothetical protein